VGNTKYTGDRAAQTIRWVARIWGALIVVYALLMLIGYGWNWVTTGVADPHVVEDVPLVTYVGLALMVLGAFALGIAWRWEMLGGAIAVVSQLVFLTLSLIEGPISLDPNFVVPCLMSITIAIPGVLFLVCWWRSRKRAIPQNSA
jgi:hypothetical protein